VALSGIVVTKKGGRKWRGYMVCSQAAFGCSDIRCCVLLRGLCCLSLALETYVQLEEDSQSRQREN
jgi:hypothetical protein